MRTLILGVTLMLGAEQALSGSTVCVTLPYCYCCPLLKNCSLTKSRYSSKSRMCYNVVKVQHPIVLCFVCSSLLLCLGLGTVGLIDYFQCS